MHQIQKVLLKRLLFQNKQRYSTLTSDYDYEDNVVFHLKQLLKDGYVEKRGSEYIITPSGIKTITGYELSNLEDLGLKTFFIGFFVENSGEYLIKEHPRGGENFHNLPSGKPHFGEPIENALIRTFETNTGLKLAAPNFKYLSLHLKTVVTPKGETLFDDAFGIYQVKITDADRTNMKLHKEIFWASKEKIKTLLPRWPEIDLCILKKEIDPYLAYKFPSKYTLDA